MTTWDWVAPGLYDEELGLLYVVTFVLVGIITLGLIPAAWYYWAKVGEDELAPGCARRTASDRASSCKKRFLAAFYLCVAAEWMQGIFLHSLYLKYGLTHREVRQLMGASCLSGLLLGTLAGVVADLVGRKILCQIYCGFCACVCLTKHVNEYYVLMFGHILGGVSTVFLLCVFEAWLVGERNMQRMNSGILHRTFMLMWFGGAGVGLIAGGVAYYTSSLTVLTPWHEGGVIFYGGDVAPFDLAILCLILGFFVMTFTWHENFGYSREIDGQNMLSTVQDAIKKVLRNQNVLLCGAVVALFECSIYFFTFLWEESLVNKHWPMPPQGTVWATLMMAMMCGVAVAQVACSHFRLKGVCTTVMIVACLALLLPGVALLIDSQMSNMGTVPIVLWSFLIFEICCGAYAPCLSIVKSDAVPEKCRATIYCMYRAPINVLVLFALLGGVWPGAGFAFAAVLAGAAAFAMMGMRSPEKKSMIKDSCRDPLLDGKMNSVETPRKAGTYGALGLSRDFKYAPSALGGEGPLEPFGGPPGTERP